MPIYEYRCSECGFQSEYLQKVSEPPLSVCPSCGKAKFQKLLSAAGFQLKGSGWYATDFRNSGTKAAKTGDSKPDAAGEAKPQPKPEAKAEAKPESKTKTKSEAPASGGGGSSA
ncbi:MAG TPA: FmdB family zinc ribbon protein [Burkholderiales bacterium]|nr:FmdB family zinc ribbon protein [Burkholderiales bacterium]